MLIWYFTTADQYLWISRIFIYLMQISEKLRKGIFGIPITIYKRLRTRNYHIFRGHLLNNGLPDIRKSKSTNVHHFRIPNFNQKERCTTKCNVWPPTSKITFFSSHSFWVKHTDIPPCTHAFIRTTWPTSVKWIQSTWKRIFLQKFRNVEIWWN